MTVSARDSEKTGDVGVLGLPDLTVVMYGYNEEECIQGSAEKALNRLHSIKGRLISDFELIIVDDGSIDATPLLARRLAESHEKVAYIRHEQNLGIGAAIKTGAGSASMHLLSAIPADGQVTVEGIEKLLPPVLKGARMAVGYFRDRAQVDGSLRMMLSKGLRLYMRLLLGTNPRMDGLFVVPLDLFVSLAPISDTFMLNLELPVRAVRSGLEVEFVPVPVYERIGGTSKVLSHRKIMNVAWEVLKLGYELRVEKMIGRKRL